MDVFNPEFTGRFTLFSPSHISVVVIFALLWIGLPLLMKKVRSDKLEKLFRITLGTVLILQYLGWMLWEAVTGRFTIQLSLPLNPCDLGAFLCAYMLFTKSYKMFEVLYFWVLTGTLQAYITPNLYFSWPHLEFLSFYIQHGGEILTILYFVFVLEYRLKFSSLVKSIAFLSGYSVFVYLFNWATNSNYLFLMADTPHPSTVTRMIALFGEPPRHIIGLVLVVVVSHGVLYLPFALRNKRKKV